MALKGEPSRNAPKVTTFPPGSAWKQTQQLASKIPYGSASVTPAITDGTGLLVSFAFQRMGEVNQLGGSSRGVRDAFKKDPEFLFGLFIFGWKISKVECVTLPKEIRHEDPSAHGFSQDISPLQSLWEVATMWDRYPRDA